MGQPSVNITSTGEIPRTPQNFRLNLPCTGTHSAEVGVTLNISVTSPLPHKPPSVISFRYNKFCMEG